MKMGAVGRAVFNSRGRARSVRRRIVPAFADLGSSLSGCRVLEIGAGGGYGAELILDVLHAARVDALDLDPVMAGIASRRLGARAAVVVADMTALPLPDRSYDAVVDIGGIHLADNWRAAIAEAARVLRPGGRFYFEQPTNPLPRWTIDAPNGGRIPGGFGRDELLDAMTAAGLEVVTTTARGLARLDLIGVARRS